MTLRRQLALALLAAGLVPLLITMAVSDVTPIGVWLIALLPPTAWLAAGWLAQPLQALLEMARRLAGGDWQARAVVSAGSEWAELAQVMADLATELATVTASFEEQVGQRTAALERKADQLRAVGQVGQQVAIVLEPERLLHFVVRVLRGTFAYDVAAVLQREGDHLVLAAAAARDRDDVPLGRVFPALGPQAPPLAAARGLVGQHAVSPIISGLRARSELAVPIKLGQRDLGILVVQSTAGDRFDDDDEFTVSTVAGQVAVALENARLLAAERQLRDLAISEERNRMAMEIHDTLAQGFMGVIMQLQALRAASDAAARQLHLDQAEAVARESLQEARRSVWNLRPLALESGGLERALAAAVAQFEQRTGVPAALTTTGELAALTAAQEDELLRIAQEALHNAAKHAQAQTVSVRLAVTDGTAELTVSDDGIGFRGLDEESEQGTGNRGFGLAGMAARARRLGGALTVQTAPGAGCQVKVSVPLRRT